MTRAGTPIETASISAPASGASLVLSSLAPEYDDAQHGVYVAALARAINEQSDVRNIALTGPYGTGKSSVLEHLADMRPFRRRVLQLSLSTVGHDEKPVPGESEVNPAARTTTNRIQKEIVKQILYRDSPDRTRGSRFRRISRFKWAPELGVALLAGAVLAVGLFLLRALQPLAATLAAPPVHLAPAVAYGLIFLLLSALVYLVRWLLHDRVFLERFTAGPATVSLASTASSFFDQYMDEIVYYFEQSGRDIVVFEDIDRFEDVQIFETLRALNALLNGSEQVQRRRHLSKPWPWSRVPRPDIKFIYALRDSVFEKLGTDVEGHDAADDEVKRANRTKFFDLVIPVVPFITHRNARDLMARTLEGTGVSSALINLAAQHVADMRLIKSMRNEYDVYASRLLRTSNVMPGLDEDRLFAMILYKSVHLADFEAIRFGKSHLDSLHDAWRDIVDESLSDARTRARRARANLDRGGILGERARELGSRLEQVARSLAHPQYVNNWSVQMDGNAYDAAGVRQRAFWEHYTSTQPALTLVAGNTTTWPYPRMAGLINSKLDPTDWEAVDRPAEQRREQKARDDIAFLRHHSWQDIFHRPEFKASRAGEEKESFAAATERLLRSRLARGLVAAGYLTDYFTLYISAYYGEHLRQEAQNYIVHALDQGQPDVNYPLDGDDVEAIITDKGTDIFRDRAAYNVNVLDHLLRHRPTEAEMMITQLAAWSAEDRTFVDQYIQGGSEQIPFVRLLAPKLPDVLRYLVDDAPASTTARIALVDTALSSVDRTVDYAPAADLAGFIRANFANFTSLGADADDEDSTTRTIDTIDRLGVRLPDTSVLNATARTRVIEHGAYDLTAENLRDLTGGDSLALDSINDRSSRVHETTLTRLDEYLAVLESVPQAQSIDAADELAATLNDVDQASNEDIDAVGQIVRRAAADCRVDNLADVPQSAWPALVEGHRVTASARNVLAYVDAFEELDKELATLLVEAMAIVESSQIEEAERVRLAIEIIGARDVIQAAEDRVTIAHKASASPSLCQWP